MPHTAAAQDSPSELPKRPRGILKNSNSFQNTPSEAPVSPTSVAHAPTAISPTVGPALADRPAGPNRELSEKEIVQLNTTLNAGDAARRNSSSAGRSSVGRRTSSSGEHVGDDNAAGQRLKWDEANLYLNEGQMGGKMKIDEPKTPYAKQYDPAQDEEEVAALDAEGLAVDELDMKKPAAKKRESDIPGLDLGEPEVEASAQKEGDEGERRVVVDQESMDVDGGHHGEDLTGMSGEEREKHRKFEELRKKHYEMKNVKSLLGHSEELDELEDDDGTAK